MKQFSELEKAYVAARVEHSVTAQNCWRLRAQLDAVGTTPERLRDLNREFAGAMMKEESR